jgi:hypothetical protein
MIGRSWLPFFTADNLSSSSAKNLAASSGPRFSICIPAFFSKSIISFSFKASLKTSLSFLTITGEVFADTKNACQVVLISFEPPFLILVGTSGNYSRRWRDIHAKAIKDSLESSMILLWYSNSASLS